MADPTIIDPFAAQPSAAAAAPAPAAPKGFVDPFDTPAAPVAAVAPAPARGALGEIGTGLARGALSDLPSLGGQALKFVGAQDVGQGMTDFGARMGQKSWLTLNPDAHNGVTNALASGAEQLAPVLAAPLAVGAAAAALPFEVPAAAIAGAGAVAGGALFGAQAGQQTQEKAEAKGVNPEDARRASNLNAAATFATMTGLGLVGGQMLGKVGNAVGKVIGTEGATTAEGVLNQMAGQDGVIKPFLKQLPLTTAEAVGVGAAQAGASAAIEQHYGVDNTDPLQAMKDSIVPMLGLTAVTTPLGLAARALAVRSAKMDADTLSRGDTGAAIREQLADRYTAALAKVDPEKAAAFRANAQNAIDTGQMLPVDAKMFNAGTIEGLPRTTEGQGDLAGGAPEASTWTPPQPGQADMFGGGGGQLPEVNPGQTDLFASPEERARSGGQADLFPGQTDMFDPTLHASPLPNTLPDEAAAEAAGAQPGQGSLLARPAEPIMSTESSAPQGPFNSQLADQLRRAQWQREFDQAQAALAAQKEAQTTALAARAKGEQEAAAAQQAYDSHAQELEALHGQVNADLRANGIEPTPITSEDPAHVESVIRENADKHEQMIADQEAERTAVEDKGTSPATESSAPEQFNTQLAEKLRAANDQRKRDLDFQKAEADQATQKQAELDAIANRTQGERLAADAEAGKVEPDANAPKQTTEITTDSDAVKQDADGVSGSAMRAFDKRVSNLGLGKLDTHQEQIDALNAAADKGGMSPDVGTLMHALAERWQAAMPKAEQPAAAEAPAAEKPVTRMAGEQPAEAKAALGENIEQTRTPDNSEPPAGTDRAAEAMPGGLETDTRQSVQGTLDKLNSISAAYNQRKRKGETLSPEETQHHGVVNELRGALGSIANGENNNTAYSDSMVQLANQHLKPGVALDMPLKMANPDAVDPAILAPALMSRKLSDVLTNLAANGSQPWVQTLAKRLNDLGLTTKIFRGFPDAQIAGQYHTLTDHIEINPGGESESTILHEATHAALFHTIERAQLIDTPRNQAEAQLKRALQDFEQVRNDALKNATAAEHYGLTDAQEFAAELMANPEFQDFLRGQGTQKSLWARAVDAVRRLFGMDVDGRNALEKAMDAANVMFDSAKNEREFNESPQGAAKATDTVLNSFAKTVDKMGEKVPMASMSRELYHQMLRFKTVDFIAHQIRGVPEMVRSGFADAVDAYRAARDSRRVAAEHLSDTLGDYTGRTRQALRATKDPRGFSEKMMTIAGEASSHGFDYAKNFAQNKAANASLDDSLKSHVDNIHRQYTQLPENLRTLLREGEKQNRKTLIQQVSTIASNLMQAATGVAPRLEAQLTRMEPEDANRARLQDRVQTARIESELANTHMRGLDMMGADLKGARNGKPDFHLDGASSALGARVDSMFKAARELPDGSPLKGQLAELERMYTAQVQHPYFSLGRDGDYFVNIAFKPGMDAQTQQKLQAALAGTNKVLGDLRDQSHAFFRVDSYDQAQALKNKMIAAGGNMIDVGGSSHGKLADKDMMSAAGVTPALRQLASDLQDSVDHMGLTGDQAVEMKSSLTRQLLSMLPETSARSARMQRRGVPGYDADFEGNFARRASGAVQDLSNAYTNRQFGASLDSMKKSIELMNRTGQGDAGVRAQMAADEVNTRYSNSMKPIDTSHINLLNSLGNSFYLALSPAFIIRTMAQPWHRGLPILASRYGAVRSSKEIAGATGVAMKVVGNTIRDGWAEGGMRGVLNNTMQFKGLGLSAADEAFVQEVHDRGILKLGQAQQLQHAITGSSQTKQDVARLASMTAQYAEMTNRLVMGLASFRLASRDKNMTPQAATEYAIRNINNAMDNFDSDNTARAIGKHGIAGKITPLLTSFMNYQLQTTQQIVRTVQDGYFGKDKSAAGMQQAKEARREFNGLMATTAMISGVMGLPFANAAAGVYNSLTKDSDDPSDIRDDVHNFLNNTFGQSGGNLLAHGVGHLINMDTSTFGLENLLPGSEFLADRRLVKDRIESQSQQLMGPALNAGINIALGMGKISDGNYIKGIEEMLPSALKPVYKASEMAGVIGPGGYTNSKGEPIPGEKPDGWATLLQGVGFRTADKATRDEAAYSQSLSQQLLTARRSVISDHAYKAAIANDPQALQDTMGEIAAFNAKNPYQPIRGVGEAIRNHMQEFAIGDMSGLGMPLTKRELPAAKGKVGYAAMPQGQ